MKIRSTLALASTIALAFQAIPTSARPLGGERPIVVVRGLPSEPTVRIYLVYAGGLSEMLVAEQAAKTALTPIGISVLPASADISDIAEMNIKANQDKIFAHIVGDPTSVVAFIRTEPVGDQQLRFKMKMLSSDGRDLVAAEVVIDTGKQMTFGSDASQALRIAIRDATARLLKDSRVVEVLKAARK